MVEFEEAKAIFNLSTLTIRNEESFVYNLFTKSREGQGDKGYKDRGLGDP